MTRRAWGWFTFGVVAMVAAFAVVVVQARFRSSIYLIPIATIEILFVFGVGHLLARSSSKVRRWTTPTTPAGPVLVWFAATIALSTMVGVASGFAYENALIPIYVHLDDFLLAVTALEVLVLLVVGLRARRAAAAISAIPTESVRLDAAPDRWIADVQLAVAGLRNHTVAVPTPSSIVITRSKIPVWAILVAIVFFPIGLLALLVKSTSTTTAVVSADGTGGSTVRLSGRSSAKLRDRLWPLLSTGRPSPAAAAAPGAPVLYRPPLPPQPQPPTPLPSPLPVAPMPSVPATPPAPTPHAPLPAPGPPLAPSEPRSPSLRGTLGNAARPPT